jgi:Stage II sporulation protein E (SpoIIE)
MNDASPWQTTPRKTSVIFLTGVFFIFASFGFAADSIDMGHQPPLHFAVSILLSGLFAVVYAIACISQRSKWWRPILPIFVVQAGTMALVNYWLPEAPRPVQFNAAQTAHLASRLAFDGVALIISVSLGYAGLVFASISEGRRHGIAQMEKATLQAEIAAAREVQRVMVPEDLPQIEGYAIESVYLPAAEVGGDFFQVVRLNSGRTLIVIGDVSGKGLRAAMIVSLIVGMLRTVCGYTEDPAEILGKLNHCLGGHLHEGFVTCLALRLEEKGRLTLANAGHIPPYVNGTEVQFPGSLPLGLKDNATYDQTTLQMAAGDGVVLLTDGVAEAANDQRMLLGFPKVESTLRAGATAKTIAELAQQQGQNDDITVLRVVRNAL